jgi:2-keto-3-deoxy-L-rhamnonate aldolase RhmA
MNNYLDKIKNKIQKKEIPIGTHIHMKDNNVSEMMGDVGFDFVWLDMEHTVLNRELIQNHLISCRATGMAAFVRVPWNDPILAKPILELGPAAIIFPFIMDAEEAKRAVEACKYPPKGRRGFGPKRANSYGIFGIEDYIKSADSNTWIILQIEHISAVRQLEKILNVDGVDSIVVGPNDLSASIGMLGKTRHPEVKKLMDEIAEISKGCNKYFGTSIAYNNEDIEDWIRRGVTWITAGTDELCIINYSKATLEGTKQIISRYT